MFAHPAPPDRPVARPVALSAPRYLLGEFVENHAELADLPARARLFGIQPSPVLWGWGAVRRTESSLEALAIGSARATLEAAGVRGSSIDAVVLCCTKFPGGPGTHGGFVQQIADGIGLRNPVFHGLTLHRCANLLAGIELANALVVAGVHDTVLVITTDRVETDASRVESYALFSDGAASCLVTSDLGERDSDSYTVVSVASAREHRDLASDSEISADLAKVVNQKLFAGTDLRLCDVRALMHANLVRPLLVVKERQAGFTADQLYLDNVLRFGHCFAADPVINLVDRVGLGHVGVGDHVILATSVPGERYAVLLQCSALTGVQR